jgi:hypothetical protein
MFVEQLGSHPALTAFLLNRSPSLTLLRARLAALHLLAKGITTGEPKNKNPCLTHRKEEAMDWKVRISSNPSISHGKVCIKGTRTFA